MVPSHDARVLEVRIHLPPADSPSLVGFLLPVSKSRQLPRRERAWPGGMTGRDLSGSSPSRQLPVMSLSGAIPVPQRPGEAVCGPWSHWYQARRVSDVTSAWAVPLEPAYAQTPVDVRPTLRWREMDSNYLYSPCGIEKPAVAAGCAGPAKRQAGRDAQGSSTSRQLPVVSLSGAIPVPQCWLARNSQRGRCIGTVDLRKTS